METWLAFLAGLVIGGTMGLLIASLCVISKDDIEDIPNQRME